MGFVQLIIAMNALYIFLLYLAQPLLFAGRVLSRRTTTSHRIVPRA